MQSTTTTKKCTCGRPAATPTEHPQAAAAGQCSGCYQINQYAQAVKK